MTATLAALLAGLYVQTRNGPIVYPTWIGSQYVVATNAIPGGASNAVTRITKDSAAAMLALADGWLRRVYAVTPGTSSAHAYGRIFPGETGEEVVSAANFASTAWQFSQAGREFRFSFAAGSPWCATNADWSAVGTRITGRWRDIVWDVTGGDSWNPNQALNVSTLCGATSVAVWPHFNSFHAYDSSEVACYDLAATALGWASSLGGGGLTDYAVSSAWCDESAFLTWLTAYRQNAHWDFMRTYVEQTPGDTKRAWTTDAASNVGTAFSSAAAAGAFEHWDTLTRTNIVSLLSRGSGVVTPASTNTIYRRTIDNLADGGRWIDHMPTTNDVASLRIRMDPFAFAGDRIAALDTVLVPPEWMPRPLVTQTEQRGAFGRDYTTATSGSVSMRCRVATNQWSGGFISITGAWQVVAAQFDPMTQVGWSSTTVTGATVCARTIRESFAVTNAVQPSVTATYAVESVQFPVAVLDAAFATTNGTKRIPEAGKWFKLTFIGTDWDGQCQNLLIAADGGSAAQIHAVLTNALPHVRQHPEWTAQANVTPSVTASIAAGFACEGYDFTSTSTNDWDYTLAATAAHGIPCVYPHPFVTSWIATLDGYAMESLCSYHLSPTAAVANPTRHFVRLRGSTPGSSGGCDTAALETLADIRNTALAQRAALMHGPSVADAGNLSAELGSAYSGIPGAILANLVTSEGGLLANSNAWVSIVIKPELDVWNVRWDGGDTITLGTNRTDGTGVEYVAHETPIVIDLIPSAPRTAPGLDAATIENYRVYSDSSATGGAAHFGAVKFSFDAYRRAD